MALLTPYHPSHRGRRSTHRQRIAERSRRASLPLRLPPQVPRKIGSVELASHYRPGDRTLDVGGDWFDAVPVDEGLVLVMGDVEGHDARAAALMVRLRAVTGIAVRQGRTPASVLAHASDWLDQIDCDLFATVLVVHIDLPSRTATAASAGHLAPALLRPTSAGTAMSPMKIETGPPLGVGQEWDERSTLLPADAVLFLYTDGLVETRADDIEERIRRLGQLLQDLPVSARTILDSALEFRSGNDQDDVAVLVAHVP